MSSDVPHPDDLEPEHTEGFKVGEKKTIEEYNEIAKNDESLQSYNQTLLGGSSASSSDPLKVTILTMGLRVEGRAEDITFDLTKPGALEHFASKPITIKEGVKYKVIGSFKVYNQVCAGLKYLQVASRGLIKVKEQHMIGSYRWNDKEEDKDKIDPKKYTPVHYFELPEDTAPSGMLGRGHYEALSKFVDDDKITHLQFKWSFDIKKDWD